MRIPAPWSGGRSTSRRRGDYVDTAIYQRGALGPGSAFTGPAVVEQMDATTVVHPGQRVEVDTFGNLLLSTGG